MLWQFRAQNWNCLDLAQSLSWARAILVFLSQIDDASGAGFMTRKLKTYQASVGFFDLAIAAPSMKAALEAWGSISKLFHQGVAKESSDPKVIAAAMSKPGVILRRPVGSNGPFKQHAQLLTDLPADEVKSKPARQRPHGKKQPARNIDDKATQKAALAFEKEQRQRGSERRKEEASRAKQREQRQRAITKVEAGLAKAKREHDARASTIEAERATLEKRSQREDARWEKEKHKQEVALRRARS
jgi:colicin import membrane protein